MQDQLIAIIKIIYLVTLLFSVVMSDMQEWCKNGNIVNFADDTSYIQTDKIQERVINNIEDNSIEIIKFMSSNALVINPEKTGLIFTKNKRNKEEITVMIGRDKIQASKSEKLLGMYIEPKQKWNVHREKVKIKLKQIIGSLQRLRFQLPKKVLFCVGEAMFNSSIRYGICLYIRPRLKEEEPSYGETRELQKLQNKMLRIVNKTKRKEKVSIKELLQKAGMMSINHMAIYHLIMETKNVLYNGTSEALRKLLVKTKKAPGRATRADINFTLPVPGTVGKGNDFTYAATKTWNAVPRYIKEEYAVAKNKWLNEEGIWQPLERTREMNNAEKTFKSRIKMWIKETVPL